MNEDKQNESLGQMIRENNERFLSDTLLKVVQEVEDHRTPGVIQEEFFVSVFLPYFAGDLDEKDFPPGISPHTWLQIAGSPLNKVNVVDRNGNVLFQVPPVRHPAGVSLFGEKASKNFKNQILYAMELAGVSRGAESQNVLNHALKQKHIETIEDQREKYLKEWAKIYLRYGYFTEENSQKDNNEIRETSTDISTLDDMIDDWE